MIVTIDIILEIIKDFGRPRSITFDLMVSGNKGGIQLIVTIIISDHGTENLISDSWICIAMAWIWITHWHIIP